MKRLSLALATLALAALTSTSAFADSVDFTFSFTGSNYSGTGTFITTSEGGDQYLVFKIVVPKGAPNEKTRHLLEEYAKLHPFDPREDAAWK